MLGLSLTREVLQRQAQGVYDGAIEAHQGNLQSAECSESFREFHTLAASHSLRRSRGALHILCWIDQHEEGPEFLPGLVTWLVSMGTDPELDSVELLVIKEFFNYVKTSIAYEQEKTEIKAEFEKRHGTKGDDDEKA